MDLLTNYPAFKKDILDSFESLIQEFDFKLLELHEGCYLLKGTHCNLRFTYDRGDINCDFKHANEYQDSPGYSVEAVYKFLFPLKEATGKSGRIYDAKLQLMGLSHTIEHLKNVLNGDFSWLNDFVNRRDRENRVFQFVLSLGYNNPIQQKLWAGDLSWQQDIQKYLDENNIIL